MNTNFAQAALRHWRSSLTLEETGHVQDAAYLAGYVGECALKAVMTALAGDSNPKAYGHDLVALSGPALETVSLFVRGMGRYISMAAPLGAVAWKPEQRYEENAATETGIESTIRISSDVGGSLLFALALDGLLEEDLS